MLVFAAITPHSPLLIPAFEGKEDVQLEKTKEAMRQLEKDLYISKAETIIILSPHGQCLDGAFGVNLNTTCQTNYAALGDLATKHTYAIDAVTGTTIKEHAQKQGFEMQMTTQDTVDHGIGVPLQFLTEHLKKAQVVPVSVCGIADSKTHFNFGYVLKEVAMNSHKPIALIASADLSHALTTDSPAGFKKEGPLFDEKIQEALQGGNSSGMLSWEPAFVEAASACGFKPIITLMGALQRVNYTFKLLSYEAPHGVGYMVAECVL
ncbi:MAG TPA: AmmeMemoRadiSam system protein B [Candidatus Magasanikbacteria bacterium]|nr:AmmeMemoRadiSam system protein B [Candidatus Magasanikbacteria bacterium]